MTTIRWAEPTILLINSDDPTADSALWNQITQHGLMSWLADGGVLVLPGNAFTALRSGPGVAGVISPENYAAGRAEGAW